MAPSKTSTQFRRDQIFPHADAEASNMAERPAEGSNQAGSLEMHNLNTISLLISSSGNSWVGERWRRLASACFVFRRCDADKLWATSRSALRHGHEDMADDESGTPGRGVVGATYVGWEWDSDLTSGICFPPCGREFTGARGVVVPRAGRFDQDQSNVGSEESKADT
ncbi:hypothetical protein B0H17DRAFT_1151374 [Mycena rosella]|uniref:Uncharacterized protein n=1 Tax=Mycena rosella TaxID=1033263 RepID=A0AAD7BKX2_MYCRO|nr:hypothetical protein B0H17DRAFT_1151374 [Mycena rosella]